MDIKYMNQPKEVQMGNILKTRLNEKFDEVWIVSGIVKDSGIDILLDSFRNAVENGTKLNTLLGVDRKNTSKDMLLKLILLGAKLSIHINSEENKVETRIFAFESRESTSYVYISGGKFSEGGLQENTCLITEIKYSKEEYESFKLFKNQLMQNINSEFKSVDKDDIALLAMKGEIVTRIIDRKIPSISELYGNKEQVIGEQVYDEGASLGLFNSADLEDVDIEFDTGIEIRNNVELEVEKEARKDIFIETNKTEEDLKRLLGKDDEEIVDGKRTRIVKELKDSDFKNMNTLIIEVGKITEKGVGANELRIPKSLSSVMQEFFNVGDSKEIELQIIDNKDNREYSKDAVAFENGKGISIKTEEFENLKLVEEDLIRLIKIDDENYKIEIIRNDTEEYNVWERYCTNNVRGTKRRYGII